MGAFLVPVTKTPANGAVFDTDGKTIIAALYRFNEEDLSPSLLRLRKFVVDEGENEHYHPVADAINITLKVEVELNARLRASHSPESRQLNSELLEERVLLRTWLENVGANNSFYLLIA